jgi:uncharacterized protein YecE (DUF72 family)
MSGRAITVTDEDRPMRHALEVRHRTYLTPAFAELLRAHHIALVVADTAGRWPLIEEATSDLVYLRLHGDVELYTSGYTDAALNNWASKIRAWASTGHDVQVHFDNDVKVHAPYDAMSLSAKVGVTPPTQRPASSRRSGP